MTRISLVSLSALMLALSACSKADKPAENRDAPRAVNFVTIARQPLASSLEATGRLVSREEAAVAPQISGYLVARVLVDQDAYVTKGQPLAILDDTLLRADITQQQAVVDQNRVAVDKAETEAGRVASLDKTGVLSEEAISQRRLTLRTARAQLAQAQAALAALRVKQGLMVVRAPVTGRVLTRSVRPGDVSAPATAMFTLAREDLIELDAEIPEASLPLLHVGDEARTVLASGREITGHIRFISAAVDSSTRLGRARISLPVDPDLRSGGFARARFGAKGPDTLAVPEAAVTYEAGGAFVIAIGADNRVRRVGVTTGRHGGGLVEITKGPPAGTKVLSGSQDFVLDGDQVAPQASPVKAR
jgi:HlyD family secretion protein